MGKKKKRVINRVECKCIITEKMINVVNSLKAIGLDAKIYPDYHCKCDDGKTHVGTILETGLFDEYEVEIIFTPMGEMVYDFRDCPILEREVVK